MGILNCTPDSFSDGGRFAARDAAVAHAEQMLAEGAGIIDVGGESTRPGAQDVSVAEEIRRVVPVIEAIVKRFGCIVSVDTVKPEVMHAACRVGAEMINDIAALRVPGALEAAAQTGAGVCIMHMQGEPRTMQDAPHYVDVVEEVQTFLSERVAACVAAGIGRDRLCVDPGFGFGKRLVHNLRLLSALPVLGDLGVPVLVGVSRKSMLGELTGEPVGQRLAAGLAAAVMAVERGALIVRTHDVRATCDALRVVMEVSGFGSNNKP
ncbi:MAG: dihydropteroate synthase [Nevskiaceae bacterium]|nr:MAG: dihydropteroate synthase [Nevskiaceae bacterium]TBR74193.1 MAG: dihydropteroate synthase [Nevskiaceae bacterium]